MTAVADFPLAWCRAQFPALSRTVAGQPVAFFDGPGGSQVPQRVIDAVGFYLGHTNANRGGQYATARESDELLEAAHVTVAQFVGSSHAESVVFGANMTTLTFAVSRAISRTWQSGDEIVVTRLDHDGNVSPWVLAARDAGVTVQYVNFDPADCTLNMSDLASKLNARTRLVAVGGASNIVGTINPVREVCRLSHAVGAQVFLDAVHYAPHALPAVDEWDCDWLACSAYKFFGPHVGVLWGRPELLTAVTPYKLRPVTESLPGRWMTGTQNFEGIAGTKAAVDYLADLGSHCGSRTGGLRDKLRTAYTAIADYEQQLAKQLISGLLDIPGITTFGLTDLNRLNERTPTVSFVHSRLPAIEVAGRLGNQGLFVGHGNFYALQFSEALGLEPQGVVRVGLMHYNTAGEIERLLTAIRGI
ncbi:MAG: cysteine desulfurase-like protein [Planctomycetes bacterium]|nr:cysteine desulfurase-like protein [Planctomycetota bacterium]